jgi:hypothetical protein
MPPVVPVFPSLMVDVAHDAGEARTRPDKTHAPTVDNTGGHV